MVAALVKPYVHRALFLFRAYCIGNFKIPVSFFFPCSFLRPSFICFKLRISSVLCFGIFLTITPLLSNLSVCIQLDSLERKTFLALKQKWILSNLNIICEHLFITCYKKKTANESPFAIKSSRAVCTGIMSAWCWILQHMQLQKRRHGRSASIRGKVTMLNS